MSKFDYMNFGYGSGHDTEFVAHAKKYTKEQTIELCIAENDWKFEPDYCNGVLLRKPGISDIKQRFVRWYVRTPENCDYDKGEGCYTYCKSNQRGSFPVWVITFKKLRLEQK